jgi:hypothetical protein
MITIFDLQEVMFNVLKGNLPDVKIFKILEKFPKERFILIESIKEEALSAGRRQFNIILRISSLSFDYSILSKIITDLSAICTIDGFKFLEGFINFKFLSSFISSNFDTGYEAKLEFACFVISN